MTTIAPIDVLVDRLVHLEHRLQPLFAILFDVVLCLHVPDDVEAGAVPPVAENLVLGRGRLTGARRALHCHGAHARLVASVLYAADIGGFRVEKLEGLFVILALQVAFVLGTIRRADRNGRLQRLDRRQPWALGFTETFAPCERRPLRFQEPKIRYVAG